MIVMKFGGSSLANAARIRHVASIIALYLKEKPFVVLSAMGDTTDELLEAGENALAGKVDISAIEAAHKSACRELAIKNTDDIDSLFVELKVLLTGISMLKELSRRSRDYLVSFGERMSVRITAAFLSQSGIPAVPIDAWDAGFVSTSDFTSAELLDSVWDTIPRSLTEYTAAGSTMLPILTGFIAKDARGNITTLGRGGSDLTATMLGAALGAKEIQTWKDVDGILTADPRIVPHALTVREVTYDEAAEMAFFGSQVLHPRSMQPCRKTGTPVRVKNSYNTDAVGSIIIPAHEKTPTPVRVITSVKHVTLIDIVSSRMLGSSGFMAHIFNQFLKWDISIDVIATSEVSVSLTIKTDAELSPLVADLERVAEVTLHKGKAIIAIICDVTRTSSILADCFAAISRNGINVQMISKSASKANISMLCDDSEADSVVRALHEAFFKS